MSEGMGVVLLFFFLQQWQQLTGTREYINEKTNHFFANHRNVDER